MSRSVRIQDWRSLLKMRGKQIGNRFVIQNILNTYAGITLAQVKATRDEVLRTVAALDCVLTLLVIQLYLLCNAVPPCFLAKYYMCRSYRKHVGRFWLRVLRWHMLLQQHGRCKTLCPIR
jgi:hypothetical protein